MQQLHQTTFLQRVDLTPSEQLLLPFFGTRLPRLLLRGVKCWMATVGGASHLHLHLPIRMWCTLLHLPIINWILLSVMICLQSIVPLTAVTIGLSNLKMMGVSF